VKGQRYEEMNNWQLFIPSYLWTITDEASCSGVVGLYMVALYAFTTGSAQE